MSVGRLRYRATQFPLTLPPSTFSQFERQLNGDDAAKEPSPSNTDRSPIQDSECGRIVYDAKSATVRDSRPAAASGYGLDPPTRIVASQRFYECLECSRGSSHGRRTGMLSNSTLFPNPGQYWRETGGVTFLEAGEFIFARTERRRSRSSWPKTNSADLAPLKQRLALRPSLSRFR